METESHAMKRMAGELSKVTAAIDIVHKKVVSGAGREKTPLAD